jgi:hypothetical protein
MIHQPNGENIKYIGDSSKKSRFSFGISLSALMVSPKSKYSISPTARAYLLVLSGLETWI